MVKRMSGDKKSSIVAYFQIKGLVFIYIPLYHL